MSDSATRYFADTTVIYCKLHGHTLQKVAARAAIGSGTATITMYIRGEYIRGYLVGLIDLYFTIREEKSVRNGILAYKNLQGFKPRKIGNALESVTEWLCGMEESDDVPKTLRRLGEYIRGMIVELDMKFPSRQHDPIRCDIGLLSFPPESYHEDLLLNFLAEFESIQAGPTCDQCLFKDAQKAKLEAEGIDLYGPAQQEAHKDKAGYVTQAKNIERALKSKDKAPACRHCDRLGDTIIALSAPPDFIILTSDAQSFPVLASLLKKPLKLIPSLKQLKMQQKEDT